ncbi:MAG: RNA polymerase sigma factor [Proteobacteria bacterium]|nr:RNA polymerase sigma factor [Pseudomonadota bacterium]
MLLTVTAPADLHPNSDTHAGAVDFDGFLREIGARAFRFAEIGLRQRDDALDAVQDAMVKMLAYRERPANEWSPLFWSILRNRMTDMQRRSLFRLRWLLPGSSDRDGEPIDWADDSPDPQRSHESREAWTKIRAALRSLPDRQREAFTLRVLEDLDVTETAAVMGCSEGSVKTHLSRARAALQKQLEDVR